MLPPTLTVALTIHDRPIPVLAKVFTSLMPQPFDQLVICLDRSPDRVKHFCEDFVHSDKRVELVELVGQAGWRSPVLAWNAAFGRVRSELLYCTSSETIQGPDNVRIAKETLAADPAVLFGKAECDCGPEGMEVNWNGRAPGNLFCDSTNPRPLGFVYACPTWAMRAVGGFDEGFAGGFWYDDDDLNYGLWHAVGKFIFDDRVTGLHQHHERPVLGTVEGQLGIRKNKAYFGSKWGECRAPWTERDEATGPGLTIWMAK